MKRIELKDSSYHSKLLQLATWYFDKNPDKMDNKTRSRFGMVRVVSVVLRHLIDKEYNRMKNETNNT